MSVYVNELSLPVFRPINHVYNEPTDVVVIVEPTYNEPTHSVLPLAVFGPEPEYYEIPDEPDAIQTTSL